jgi:hypothetical protein
MTNTAHPAVPITFAGKLCRLIFDYNALAELEDHAGTFMSKAPNRKLVRVALWAGMLGETLDESGNPTKETLSLREVGDVLERCSPDEVGEFVVAVMKARGLAIPPPEDENPTTAQSPSDSTGSSSGPSPDTTSA